MRYFRTKKITESGSVYEVLQEARLNKEHKIVWIEIMRVPITPSGGGGGSQPGPNTVGTEEIIDGAVELEDLNQEVLDEMITKDDRVTAEDLNHFDV